MHTIETLEELIKLATLKKIMILDFYAGWCKPCKRLSPIFEELSKCDKYKNLIFIKVNVDEDLNISKHYEITSLPTILFLDPTLKVLEKIVGMKKDVIEKTIEKMALIEINNEEEINNEQVKEMNNNIFNIDSQ